MFYAIDAGFTTPVAKTLPGKRKASLNSVEYSIQKITRMITSRSKKETAKIKYKNHELATIIKYLCIL